MKSEITPKVTKMLGDNKARYCPEMKQRPAKHANRVELNEEMRSGMEWRGPMNFYDASPGISFVHQSISCLKFQEVAEFGL